VRAGSGLLHPIDPESAEPPAPRELPGHADSDRRVILSLPPAPF
jgi:hypothetical protein